MIKLAISLQAFRAAVRHSIATGVTSCSAKVAMTGGRRPELFSSIGSIITEFVAQNIHRVYDHLLSHPALTCSCCWPSHAHVADCGSHSLLYNCLGFRRQTEDFMSCDMVTTEKRQFHSCYSYLQANSEIKMFIILHVKIHFAL